jgi:Fe-S cluster assembly protein SufD
VPPFTPDAAAALGGPDWLRRRRAAAAEQFASTALPTAEEEIWRYSRIGQLDLDRYRPAGGAATAPGADPLPGFPDAGQRSGLVVTVNGRIVSSDLPGRDLADRVSFGAGAEDLGRVMTEPLDAFSLLNDAFAAEPVVLSVARNVTLDRPLVVVHWLTGDPAAGSNGDRASAAPASFPRLAVRAGANSHVDVVEIFASADIDGFVVPVTELRVERDARLGYLAVQDLGLRVWQIATQVAEVDTQATLVSSVAAFGGDYARLRTDCRLVGRGATGNLDSLYFGNGGQMLDFRTFQDHRAPDTTSDLLFKGAVDDDSHSVYTGLIRVRPDARGTNAFQTNRNIKLSPGAWAESVPNLEIENNDVRCSHASTVGPIDLDQRFYLESRGVPPAVAERLIVGGFFDEVIDALPAAAYHPAVRRLVGAKLGQVAFGSLPAASAADLPAAAAAPAAAEVAR